jgi:hypothetical protein
MKELESGIANYPKNTPAHGIKGFFSLKEDEIKVPVKNGDAAITKAWH